MKKLASWNVNGIRACAKKGFVDWLEGVSPDIACLQEIKAMQEQFPAEVLAVKGYRLFVHSAKKPGYSGVAVLSKEEPKKVIDKIGVPEFDDEGRILILEFKNYTLFNCYFPNGQRDHKRVPYKLKFSDTIQELLLDYSRKRKPVVICGDFNTAHQEIDLANPKTNHKTTGFLPIERAWMDQFMASGFEDCFRLIHGDKPQEYTWWTYRNDCRGRNIGWRIDYFFVNKKHAKKVLDSSHGQEVLGSDHCPLYVDVEVD